MIDTKVIEYDLDRYDFPSAFGRLFGLTGCELTMLRDDSLPLVDRDHDQETQFHKTFYQSFSTSRLEELYQRFARHVGCRVVGPSFLYQTIPTFRVSLPGNMAVGEWHRDTEYNHQEEEVNVWVPVTEAFDTNTIWIEDRPYDLVPGQALIFSGALLHGNKVNETGQSRVSFDFRLIEPDVLADDGRETLHSKMPFRVGEYWS